MFYRYTTDDKEKYKRMAETIMQNFFIIEGYKCKRLYKDHLERYVSINSNQGLSGAFQLPYNINEVYFYNRSIKNPAYKLYSPLYPSYLIRNNTVITIPKGDSIILSLSTFFLATAIGDIIRYGIYRMNRVK